MSNYVLTLVEAQATHEKIPMGLKIESCCTGVLFDSTLPAGVEETESHNPNKALADDAFEVEDDKEKCEESTAGHKLSASRLHDSPLPTSKIDYISIVRLSC